jgi:hypothetical protein
MTHPDSYGSDALPLWAEGARADPPPVEGVKRASGDIRCGCGATTEDNSSPGLKPSCRFCWRAIDLVSSSAS